MKQEIKVEPTVTAAEDQQFAELCNDDYGFVVADFSVVKHEEEMYELGGCSQIVDDAADQEQGLPVAASASAEQDDEEEKGETEEEEDGNSNECKVCRKMYSSPSSRRKHQETHARQKRPFACGECGKAFQTRFNLKRHVLVHTGARPFNCQVCDRGFAERGHLLVHQRIHTHERPFECSYCHWSFAHKPHVTEHERIHSGERPFECHHCGKTFKRQTHRRSHERNVHKKDQGLDG